MRMTAIAATAIIAAPCFAQTAVVQHTIDVTGHGKVSVPPDTAIVHYWLRGEGKTADDATRQMVEAQHRVESGLKEYLGADVSIANSTLIVMEARDPACKTQYGQAAISEGNCAIVGYIASSEADVTTRAIHKAPTAVGLAGRLGARDSRLQSFELRDTAPSRQTAMIQAVTDAKAQAQILAAAANGHLGRVISIQYGSYGGIPGRRFSNVVFAPAAPPPPPPPVQVDMKPRPQEIAVDVSVSYELLQ